MDSWTILPDSAKAKINTTINFSSVINDYGKIDEAIKNLTLNKKTNFLKAERKDILESLKKLTDMALDFKKTYESDFEKINM